MSGGEGKHDHCGKKKKLRLLKVENACRMIRENIVRKTVLDQTEWDIECHAKEH